MTVVTTIRNGSSTARSSVLLGLIIGGSTVALGALTAVGGPVAGLGALAGLGVALYVLTDLMGGLYITLAIVTLLPFATLPVKVAVTPTFIDLGLAAFALVYLGQWMTGVRSRPRFMRAHVLILSFIGFVIFCFVAGLGHGLLTTTVLRQFVELCAVLVVSLILADVIRDAGTLRRVILVILVLGAVQAVVGIVLVLMNSVTAERLLNTLSRLGYPSGAVIRYVEENPDLAERAIGTWIDPNAYGGFLVIVGTLGLSQVLAVRPVTGSRWLALALLVPVGVALLFTQSRGAWVGLAAAGFLMAVARRRWILPVGVVAVVLFFVLPVTQDYAARFVAGLTNQDLATQMRFGEYKDALILIGRYPIIGVGFAGVPERDIYLGVSSLYLTIAEETGLVGLALFALSLLESFRYGLIRWRRLRSNPAVFDVWFGLATALFGALISGIFDHFYFDLSFNGAALMFWLAVGLMLAAARLSDDVIDQPALRPRRS